MSAPYGGRDAGAGPPPGPPPPRPPPAPNFHTVQVHQPIARSCVPPPPPPQPQTPHRTSPPPRRSSPLPLPTLTTTTGTTNNGTTLREVISLDMVHDRPRAANEYVDTPTSTVLAARTPNSIMCHHTSSSLPTTTTTSEVTRLPVTQQPTSQHHHKKQQHTNNAAAANLDGSGIDSQLDCKMSIICPHCNKCRCGQCTGDKELPVTWLCNGKCELSGQNLVECASCVCVVKALFYHCCSNAEGDTSVSPADDPCGCCDVTHCFKRWTCMGLMSVALPCLCLYWPLKCVLSGCTVCYNCCRRQGCRCRRDKVPGSKHLLLDSESSSA